jgi:hypothetical protein
MSRLVLEQYAAFLPSIVQGGGMSPESRMIGARDQLAIAEIERPGQM